MYIFPRILLPEDAHFPALAGVQRQREVLPWLRLGQVTGASSSLGLAIWI